MCTNRHSSQVLAVRHEKEGAFLLAEIYIKCEPLQMFGGLKFKKKNFESYTIFKWISMTSIT